MRTNWTICGNLMFPRKCDKLTTEIHFEHLQQKSEPYYSPSQYIFFKIDFSFSNFKKRRLPCVYKCILAMPFRP